MQRYFVHKDQFLDDQVFIKGDDVKHISKVLRLKQGDMIICSNGEGLDVLGKIKKIERDQVICNIEEVIQENNESPFEVILAQGLPKGDKMDWIIQKGTEIGVTSFLPFTSERTIVQLDENKEQKRLERWRKIAKEAAEQAHRSAIPKIHPVLTWEGLLDLIQKEFTLIAYEQENTITLYQALSKNSEQKRLLLVIGPEGGFSTHEVQEAIKRGAISISLGKRILRTETAGLVGVANILYHLEGKRG
ncbi:16S rRNA (uracil(1498)-N(3))-methyltransferase [Tepidibacillus fermentans]|uniref:Ribosomal RNA small subunit methyltransferase E n=1 Tax=Tepidibacillus fermentans TaxID=1281767 RepID=A0A4R3KKG8_9BACI|nr:16S rRNA (uracil(1498)-N(3))-methyltransferase [Tepidibacillus fermentans]TCS83741.1 16S rRNA (uracil1498-N3)-methyltransferase [Tepidibacillus fermentans]